MAIVVYRRPTGHVLIPFVDGTVPVNAVLGGTEYRAVFYVPSHGRSDGNVIYIKSEVAEYNGFVYVNVIDADQFSIQSMDKPYAASDPELDLPFIKTIETATIYRDFLTHGWNCVHTPINYILHTDLWPTNTVDTTQSISSVTDSNGYCNITAGGDIKATGSANALQYVKITGAGDYNGVYQIISWSSDTSFVINLAYSAGADAALTGQSVQYYYNNLLIKVRIYAGLPPSHHFESQKPYELLATLDLIPNDENEVKFSIHDILKKHIDINNNLLRGTLPNNVDAFTTFYITYAEEYDTSDGSTLSRSTPSYTDDSTSFMGYAVNSILPFKSVHAGSLSEYVTDEGLSGKFLTNFERPTIFSGKYFDLSFLFDNKYYDGVGEFSNQVFTSNITGWSSYDGSNASGSVGFAWNSDGGNGAALADGTAGGETNTKYFAAPKANGSTWKPGDYQVTVRAKNASINQALTVSVALYGMNSSSAETNIPVTGTVTYPRDSTYYSRTLTFTLTEEFDELAFRWVNPGGVTTFRIAVYVDSIVMDSYPAFSTVGCGLLEEYYSGDSYEERSITDLSEFDSGVYRAQLTDPDCDYNRVDATILLARNLPAPSTWSDGANAFPVKTATTLGDTAAGGTKSAYIEIDPVAIGETFRIVISWTLDGTPGGTSNSDINLYTNTGLGTPASVEQTITIPNIAGTYTHELEFVATDVATVFFINHNLNAGAVGETMVITMPSRVYVLEESISETKTIDIDCECSNQSINLSWLNNLGGFDHWNFKAEKEYTVEIGQTGETKKNIFPSWPNSYGEFADTIRKQTYRESRNQILVRSQHLTQQQVAAISVIKSSPLVQIVNSIYDRRTVLVDTNSFKVYDETTKEGQHTIQFIITYTDDIPSQRI